MAATFGWFARDKSKLFIDINQHIEDPSSANGFKVSTKFYLYSIADENNNDLIGFHYHPELTEDPVPYPHIHAYADQDARFLSLNLHKRHIPSGRVALEDVVRWLIDEMKVTPIRDDWDTVLAEAKEKFTSNRSWA